MNEYNRGIIRGSFFNPLGSTAMNIRKFTKESKTFQQGRSVGHIFREKIANVIEKQYGNSIFRPFSRGHEERSRPLPIFGVPAFNVFYYGSQKNSHLFSVMHLCHSYSKHQRNRHLFWIIKKFFTNILLQAPLPNQACFCLEVFT